MRPCLVNNAAATQRKRFLDTTAQDWQAQVDVTVTGMPVTRACCEGDRRANEEMPYAPRAGAHRTEDLRLITGGRTTYVDDGAPATPDRTRA